MFITKKAWVLFGFSEALADILDIVHSKNDLINDIVLNINVDNEKIRNYLIDLRVDFNIKHIDHFIPRENECYNFCFHKKEKALLVNMLKDKFNLSFDNLVHPSSILSSFAEYGEGLLIGPGVIVTAGAKIASHVRLNRGVTIGHNSIIHNYTHIGPGVIISGRCTIGENCFIGSGAILRDHVTIGANTIVGAGSLVVNNIPNNVVAFGHPARPVRENNDN